MKRAIESIVFATFVYFGLLTPVGVSLEVSSTK